MKEVGRAFVGEWRIIEMDAWDAGYLDVEVPAHIMIHDDLTATFQFDFVHGDLDA